MGTVVTSEHRWLLPASLTDDTTNPPRSTRDWIVDTALFLLALLGWLMIWADIRNGAKFMGVSNAGPDWLVPLDVVIGLVLCVMLWGRRRWPVQLAVAATVLGL